ncbi:MAG: tetratricopeptide repeat protein [Pseudomonadota bacterium]
MLLFACLAINSIYLGAVTLIEWTQETNIQNLFYQWMFLGHLVLGLLLVLPAIIYGLIHFKNARNHRNRRAVKAGYAVFATMLLLLITGLMLTRGLPLVELKDPQARTLAYWLHIIAPFLLAWLYVLHRLVGKAIRWRSGALVLGIAALISVVAIVLQSQDPRRWNQTGPDSAERYFFPSLARTVDGQFIAANSLMMDEYCQECHQDVHESWEQSMHRFSSFNNPAYAFSVNKTREFLQQRDGNVQAVRFCAGCHDPVPFFSGAMDQPNFGSHGEETAHAGITCSVCHSITHVNSPRGNADYTIEAPLHYPFAYSDQEWLQWINKTLVKAKPEFHKQTFLKPLHQSTEFCASCHKVHLPKELNDYKWLRGQNHYDSFLLSGVSGHSVQSFYYPPKAEQNCNNCHMPLQESDDFAAKRYAEDDELSVHNHQFAAGNTGIPHMLSMPDWVNDKQRQALTDVVRVDIFGIREAGRIDGELSAPLNPDNAELEAGKDYLLEVVIRTTGLGHHFTQGTADSNQVWVNLQASSGETSLGESGQLNPDDGKVDPWSHFVNAYVIDREGQRIDRRNPENIFTQLYNHQIPPGAADVVHYLLQVPEEASGNIDVAVALNYRKFDTQYLQYIQGEDFAGNDLPVTEMARDTLSFRVQPTGNEAPEETSGKEPSSIPEWQRWNDYGIALLRREQYRQAEEAFAQVEAMGRGDGALNLARVYLREGRLDEAADSLRRASGAQQPAPAWTISYFTAQLNLQNGYIDEAIAAFRELVATRFPIAQQRGFDFSKDYRLLNDLALALAERAKFERGAQAQERAAGFRREAVDWYQQTLALDPENVTAHYGLAQLYEQLGELDSAAQHRGLHAVYKVDDNAKDRAVQLARKRDPAADRAANKVVIYQLN